MSHTDTYGDSERWREDTPARDVGTKKMIK